MGQDHPVTWCKLYDGDNINDNTGTPKNVQRRPHVGHLDGSLRRLLHGEPRGNNNLIKQIVGGVRWVAGEGKKSDCSGTVWSSFTRTVIVPDANNPIGIDVAKDGKVYWSEIGNPISLTSTGYIKMYDPAGPAGNKTTVASIPTRADHGNSEDGVLGMSLQPGFDLAGPGQAQHLRLLLAAQRPTMADHGHRPGRRLQPDQPLHAQRRRHRGRAGSERLILKVPKAKITGSPSGFPGGPTNNGPGHVGGAGLDFDSDGNLYLGVGDDVSPGAGGHNDYPPMDHRAAERWDARKTSANSADLRGKVIRIKPLQGDDPVGRDARRRLDVHDPRGQPVRRRHGEGPSRDLRDGLPAAVHAPHRPGQPGHRGRRRVLPRQLGQRRQPRSGRHVRVEPDQHARLLRLAVLRRQQLGGEHVVPLELHDERDDRLAVRLLAVLAAVGHPLRADRRDPGRADQRRSGHHPRPGDSRDDLEEVRRRGRRRERRRTSATSAPAACSRSPVRSTATTRPTPARARSRATTTARG